MRGLRTGDALAYRANICGRPFAASALARLQLAGWRTAARRLRDGKLRDACAGWLRLQRHIAYSMPFAARAFFLCSPRSSGVRAIFAARLRRRQQTPPAPGIACATCRFAPFLLPRSRNIPGRGVCTFALYGVA